jgi:hypothetical protein
MSELTDLERAVLCKLLDGEDENLAALRRQLEIATVESRDMTGVGFYTKLVVRNGSHRLSDRRSAIFGDVIAEIRGLRNGAGFLLFVTEGLLDILEGYSTDEPWPKEITSFKLRYERPGERDLDGLRSLPREPRQEA